LKFNIESENFGGHVKSSKAVWAFLVFAFLAPAAAIGGPPQETAVREFKMTAKKYEFDPAVITVKQGDKVRLIITALDRKHGFELKEYGINQVLRKDDPTTIEFAASKPGTFVFRCSVFCGWGHRKMKGKLIVEKAN
jgi:cytochrome c oxidase subunit II